MDRTLFDRLSRALVFGASRRTAFGLATLIAFVERPGSDAKKRKRKRKKKCKRGQDRCKKKCVDTRTSRQHCGKCGNACLPDESCVDGSCLLNPCPDGFELCNGSCVDLMVNLDHCGSCNQVCHGELVCREGACSCDRDVCLVNRFDTDLLVGPVVSWSGSILVVIEDALGAFAQDGVQFETIGEFGVDPGEFRDPSGLATDIVGNIYVADSGNDRVQILNLDDSIDVWDLPFAPYSVATTLAGVTYVSQDFQIVRLNAEGQVEYSWGPGGDPDSEFDSGARIAADENGLIYICDQGGDMIYRFTDNGNGDVVEDWSVGAPGIDPGEFNRPTDIAAWNGVVIVADEGNRRVQALSAEDGSYLFSWAAISPNNYPAEYVALDRSNRAYLTAYPSIFIYEFGSG